MAEALVCPCGGTHGVKTFLTTDGRSLPIMLGPLGHPWNRPPAVWCPDSGWVNLSDEQFREIDTEFGGHA